MEQKLQYIVDKIGELNIHRQSSFFVTMNYLWNGMDL